MKKLAFLFIIYDEILHEDLWWNFFKNVDPNKFSIYIHFKEQKPLKYFEWAKNGWNKIRADRYPMGKGVKPLYSYWNGSKFPYIEARLKIYAPLYAEAVQKTEAFKQLKSLHETGEEIWLWDFDGYDFRSNGMTYKDVILNEKKKMGHAFVLSMLLENQRIWETI